MCCGRVTVGPARRSGGRCGWVIPGGVTLPLGTHVVDPPVVLVPMARITNVAFRQLCREQGAGIYVCEMITTVTLAHRNPKTDRMIEFGADETPRSMQIYGVDPEVTAKAVRRMVDENLADHIDMKLRVPEVAG